jgi:hypothetical protein
MLDAALKKMLNRILEERNNFVCNKKINRIYQLQKHKFKGINKKVLLEHKKKWRKLSKKINDRWFKVYSKISGIESMDFVPENIYYNIIEPCLNNRVFTTAYADKNFHHLRFNEKQLFPETLLQNIDGVNYNSRYQPLLAEEKPLFERLKKYNKIIIKPSTESGGGRKVRLFIREKEDVFYNSRQEKFTLNYLKKGYSSNFLIQEYIEQHDFYQRFNPSSVNTVRIFTYRSVTNEEIIPLHAVLRVGRQGKIVDNQASGGIACGIAPGGRPNHFAVDKWGNVYESTNAISFSEVGEIFMFEKMVQYAKALAPKMFYSRLNGFDFCVDRDAKVRLLEINCKNIEINFLQMSTGPLFKEYTDEVIEYCRQHPKSICLDFYV